MSLSPIADPVNRRILAVAEDALSGFDARPFRAIGERCGLDEADVLERISAMLAAGTILRLRQITPSTALTHGCLIAWQVPEPDAAFEWLSRHDPATGHIVIRRALDAAAPGADYRLWTTLKLPASADAHAHCERLATAIGATNYARMPVVGMFALSVGHIRRAGLPPGTLLPEAPVMQVPPSPTLSPAEHAVLQAFREPLGAHELAPEPWVGRAQALGMEPQAFYALAHALVQKGALGRFAAVLNHTLPPNRHTGTGSSALFMWAVRPGQEEAAGAVCGRHVCMTHCYWRAGAERFGGVQIMGVVHAPELDELLAHKAAIDAALSRHGIELRHSAVLLTERALVKPSRLG